MYLLYHFFRIKLSVLNNQRYSRRVNNKRGGAIHFSTPGTHTRAVLRLRFTASVNERSTKLAAMRRLVWTKCVVEYTGKAYRVNCAAISIVYRRTALISITWMFSALSSVWLVEGHPERQRSEYPPVYFVVFPLVSCSERYKPFRAFSNRTLPFAYCSNCSVVAISDVMRTVV